jgi:hypothetical protein
MYERLHDRKFDKFNQAFVSEGKTVFEAAEGKPVSLSIIPVASSQNTTWGKEGSF